MAGALVSPDARLRLRQGVIATANADSTIDVMVAGSATVVPGVRCASDVCPVPGSTVWLATDGRDLFAAATLAPTSPAWATMRKATTQTVGTSTWTALTWGSRVDEDSSGLTIGPNGLTVVAPGLYHVVGAVAWATNTTGNRYAQVVVNDIAMVNAGATATTVTSRTLVSAIVKCAIGDVINLAGYQSSGGNLATDVGTGSCVLMAVWLGPAG